MILPVSQLICSLRCKITKLYKSIITLIVGAEPSEPVGLNTVGTYLAFNNPLMAKLLPYTSFSCICLSRLT